MVASNLRLHVDLPVLSFAPGEGDVQVDLQRLVQSRLLVQASSGAGKSWLLRYLCEQTAGRIAQTIIDWEGEFASLREVHPYVIVGGLEPDVPMHPRTARIVCRRLAAVGASVILDLSELGTEAKREYAGLYLEELIHLPRSMWQPRLVVIDEAHELCPQAGEVESSAAVKALVSRGRKRGYAVVLATQRLAKLHKDAAEVQCKLFGRTILDVDLRRVADELGFDKRQAQEVRGLQPGQFFAIGPAIGDGNLRLVCSGSVRTDHPDGTAQALAPAQPAEVAEALKALATEDLAIDEDSGRQELLEQIERLEQELRAAKEGSASDPADIRRAVDQATRPLHERIRGLELQVARARHHATAILLDQGALPDEVQPSAEPEPEELPPLKDIQESMLKVLRECLAMHRDQLAAATGQSPKSSTFRENVKVLVDRGLIYRPEPGWLAVNSA